MHNSTEPEKPVSARKRLSRSEKINTNDDALRMLGIVEYLLLDCWNSTPSYRSVDFVRDRNTIRKRCVHEGVPFFTSTLPSFFDSLLNSLENGVSSFPGWKLGEGAYPLFLSGLTRMIVEHPNDGRTAKYVKLIYQLTYSFKKLKGPYTKSTLNKQLVEFCEIDSDLSYLDLDVMALQPIIKAARRTISKVCRGYDPFDTDQAEYFLPRPGPGATNSPTEYHERFRPHVVYTQLSEVFDYNEWFHPPSYRTPATNRDLRLGKTRHKYETKSCDSPTSRLKFVHKTYGKARSICIEENETQYLQQAISNGLRHAIGNCSLTKDYINFADQSINGKLALESSRTKQYSTIDMSAASDRIWRDLVEKLFWDNEPMLRALMACSTRVTTIPDTINFITDLPTHKYAPMGSALCFPVMSLVHFSLIRAIIDLHGDTATKSREVYVYGDDIIVDCAHIPAIYKWLPMFGMKINEGKSFAHSLFRESCGVHAYNGVDVTPTRFKHLVKSHPTYPELISVLNNEAALFKAGFTETARYIRTQFRRSTSPLTRSLPYVSERSACIGFMRADNGLLAQTLREMRQKWDGRFHRWLYKAVVVVPVKREHKMSEYEGYLRWLLVKPRGNPREDCRQLSATLVVGSDAEFRIRHQWVPAQAIV